MIISIDLAMDVHVDTPENEETTLKQLRHRAALIGHAVAAELQNFNRLTSITVNGQKEDLHFSTASVQMKGVEIGALEAPDGADEWS